MSESEAPDPTGGDGGDGGQSDRSDGDVADEVCAAAMDAAIDRGMDHCDSPEQAMRQLAEMYGVSTNGDGEPDVDAEAALAEGLNEETLASIQGTRQWVMSRVFNATPEGDPPLLEEHDGDVRAATREAWAMVDDAAAEMEADSDADADAVPPGSDSSDASPGADVDAAIEEAEASPMDVADDLADDLDGE